MCFQILKSLEEQLDRLKGQASPGAPGETSPLAERVEKLKEKAKTLTNTTLNMTDALEGNAGMLLYRYIVLNHDKLLTFFFPLEFNRWMLLVVSFTLVFRR